MRGYLLSPEADSDLVEIWSWIAKDSVELADRVDSELHVVDFHTVGIEELIRGVRNDRDCREQQREEERTVREFHWGLRVRPKYPSIRESPEIESQAKKGNPTGRRGIK